jgi:glucose-6-phosphate 1-dehydrogenase
MWYSPDIEECDYLPDALTIFVVGASGDLAKKKTYPSLFDLHRRGFLTKRTTICGYARSYKSDMDFREQINPFLRNGTEEQKKKFLDVCIYRQGAYDSAQDVGRVFQELEKMEQELFTGRVNRLFYFAIPPSIFVPIGKSIKEALVKDANPHMKTGWTRLIIEKPFGNDSKSFEELSSAMSALYTEDYIYRIDHYLGKEMVQNLVILRFSNAIFEPVWNRNHINSVVITFKEDFGTKGRGGYFDSYGIIRDVIQNHLLQVMCLVAMEPPVAVTGENSANFVRDEKVKVLNCIDPVKLEDCVLGQYQAAPDGREVAYAEDPTVPDDSVTPTFATMILWINNPRWDGVPFIIKAGKALNERKAEIRIQFKTAPAAKCMFAGQEVPRNELVMRLQPDEAVYMKTNVKSPGLMTRPVTSELDLSYKDRYNDVEVFDAYTRLILEVIRGRQATFVRDDELKASWAIFTPLLHQIEKEKIKPIMYEYGSRGPAESDELIEKAGFHYHGGTYEWQKS